MLTLPCPRRPRGADATPLAVVALFAVGLSGCGGGKYPVRGTVALDDGTPVTRGLIVFERADGSPPVTARGNIGPDGKYALSTDKPGDGVPLGRYKVLVNPMDLSDLPDEQKNIPFAHKYLKFETSGLEFEVKAGANEFPITLERSRRGHR
jgi:hypothetical protein